MNNEHVVTRPRILLVDNHPLMLEWMRTLLQSAFVIVGDAHTGREMVMQAMELHPDVIVADIAMPELSGIEAARELRNEGFTPKLVFLSIYPANEFVDACMAEGALGYVVKAQMATDLVPAIKAALAGRSFVSDC